MAARQLRKGDRIGRYELLARIHEGEYASIYRGMHKVLDREVALKILHLDVPDELPDAMQREARYQAAVQHRNVLGVYDAFETDGRTVLVLEYVRTQSMAELLDRRRLSLRAALGLFKGVVRGVRAMHVRHLVHRDLKPENILLAKEEGRVVPKIADFGLAKELEPGAEPAARHLSQAFSYLGTPEYMAPEQAADPGTVDARADLFSLGCLLYELTAHRVCFDAEAAVDAMYRAATKDYVPLDAVDPELPEPLARIVDDLLEPKPQQRLADCDLLLERLDAIRA